MPIGFAGAAGASCFALSAGRQLTAAQPAGPSLAKKRASPSGLGLVFFAAVCGLNYVDRCSCRMALHYTPTGAWACCR